MIPKRQPVRSQQMRAAARGRPCTVRLPGVCRHDTESTVLAHPPVGNGGMGTKGGDHLGAFACQACHDALDGRANDHGLERHEIYECWIRGHQETLEIWRELGVIRCGEAM